MPLMFISSAILSSNFSAIPKQQRVQKFLNKMNPPTMRDIALDMNRVGDALSEIDAAVAKCRQ
jgi:hypothetical protein